MLAARAAAARGGEALADALGARVQVARSGTSRSSQVSGNATKRITAPTMKTGCSATETAARYAAWIAAAGA